MEETKRGRLIVIDGARGCNRDPVVEKVREECADQNLRFLHEPRNNNDGIVFQPGDMAGEMEGLMWRYHSVMGMRPELSLSSFSRLLYYMTSRWIFVEQVLIPTLEKGQNILLKRFDCSTYAYQIFGEELRGVASIFWSVREAMLNNFAKSKIHPPHYIILNVKPELGFERSRAKWTNKKGFEESQKGAFEHRDLDFHARVCEGYIDFPQRTDHAKLINANQTLEKTSEEVAEIVQEILSQS